MVVQLDLDSLAKVRHTLAEPHYNGMRLMEMENWSPFRKTIGEFFISAGGAPPAPIASTPYWLTFL